LRRRNARVLIVGFIVEEEMQRFQWFERLRGNYRVSIGLKSEGNNAF